MYLQKVISRKTFYKIISCWHLEGQCRKKRIRIRIRRHGSANPDPDLDPHQNDMDRQHWRIRVHCVWYCTVR
jgi:hypothetical protein